MAIIYTYPQISTLSLSDSVLITDNVTQDPAKRTKQATVQQLKTLINGSPLSLTTNFTSGAATLSSGNVLNVPNYSGGSGTVGPGTSGNVSIFSGPAGSSSTIGNSVMSQHAGNDGSSFNDEYFKIEGTGGIWTGNIRLGGTGGTPAGDGALIDYQGSKGGDGQVLTSTGLFSRWEDIPITGLQIGTFINETTTLNVGGQILTVSSLDNGTTVSINTNLLGQITAKRIPFVDGGGELKDSNLEQTSSTETIVKSGSLAVNDGGIAVKDGSNSKVTIEGPGAGAPGTTADYVIKLPNEPTAEYQYLGTPKTLGSPNQLEWFSLPITAVTGASPISVTGSGTEKVIGITSPITVGNGGTGIATAFQDGIVRGNGTNGLAADANFTYNGSTGALTLAGQLVATPLAGQKTASVRGIASNSTSTQGWGPDLGVANFDQNDTSGFSTTIAVNTESTGGKLISFYYQENSGTGPKGEIKYDTTSSQVQYNVTSDYRLKENIVDLTSAVDRVKNLKPKRFNFIGNATQIDGFLAHEVQEVVPQAVSGTKDQVFEDGQVNPQQMDASKLVPVLTAAIKELTARIEALEA